MPSTLNNSPAPQENRHKDSLFFRDFIIVFILFFSRFLLQPQFRGTLKPVDNFDALKDAEALRKAMQGSGEGHGLRIKIYKNIFQKTFFFKIAVETLLVVIETSCS